MIRKILIANRGEIAIRVAQAAHDYGARSLAIHSTDDSRSLHVRAADESTELDGHGVAPYLDIEQVIGAALKTNCDALHPGYGFLSESADLARRCAEENITFIGPSENVLELFGHKQQAREFASSKGVSVAAASAVGGGVEGAIRLMSSLPPGGSVIVKAVAGGGGRGMRVVSDAAQLPDAFRRASAEAKAAFGNGDVYAERLVQRARHIEIQILGDGAEVTHFWERECSLQRRRQKLVEIAPSPSLRPTERRAICDAAVELARQAGYRGLGTFEFLLDLDSNSESGDREFVFMEVNPRIQVEHTVTEMITGVDLAVAQIQVAAGASLADLSLRQVNIPEPRGHSIQVRINMETLGPDGRPRPAGGRISVFEPPSGPGLRVDAMGYAGYAISSSFDPLLAKLIVTTRGGDFAAAVRKARRALEEFRVEGIETNIPFQLALLADPEVARNEVHTRFVEDNIASFASGLTVPERFFRLESAEGARPDERSPAEAPLGTVAATAGMLGTVVAIFTEEGSTVAEGRPIAVVEAMKMEHVITAPASGRVRVVVGAPGEAVEADQPLLFIEPRTGDDLNDLDHLDEAAVDLDTVRPDLERLRARLLMTTDEGRPEAVAKRHATGSRTARENIADLVDPGSLIEYGAFGIAPQRARRPHEELLRMSPADGVITGLASINSDVFGSSRSRAAVMAYDWTVFGGSQGMLGHKKKDRLFRLADELELPVVMFAEGGGGRPGDTEFIGAAGLDTMSFSYLARLSGLVPLIGITNRYCFAGNAALLAICDVIIATEDSNIGMAGPAMIRGAGLGEFDAKEIGSSSVQSRNGVIDVLVKDEEEAVQVAKKYLAFFQGALPTWECADQRLLRNLIPEERLRSYDVRTIIHTLADTDSVLELRPEFGIGMVTALARIEGTPVGVLANNCRHLGGAADADAADKGARFMQLCDAFGIPLVMLVDTPGFMVGPEAEKTAQVRHFGRLFVTGANLTIPIFSFVLRKGYGLGALGSSGGGFHTPKFTVAWPTGEFGGMGFEGHVRLAYAKELARIDDEDARELEYQRLVDKLYEKGSALGMAEDFEIDAVIDPVETRRWIRRGLDSLPPKSGRRDKRRPNVDTW